MVFEGLLCPSCSMLCSPSCTWGYYMLREQCAGEHSRLMPPAVNRSTTVWSDINPLFDVTMPVEHHHLDYQAPRNHVLLSSAALSTPLSPLSPVSTSHYSIMQYEGVESLHDLLPSFAPSNVLENKNYFDFSSILQSTQIVLDPDDDMSASLGWTSTASSKKIDLVLPDTGDCWAFKPVHDWAVEHVNEWLLSVGVSEKVLEKKRIHMNGMTLIELFHKKDALASLEEDLEVQQSLIYEQLKEHLLQDPAVGEASTSYQYGNEHHQQYYHHGIKQEDMSQSESSQQWSTPSYSMDRSSTIKHECTSDEESEPEHLPAETVRGARTGRRGRPPSVTSKAAKRKLEKRHGRLWEFIRDLLKNPDYCPSLICWENHDEGVFRFVSSEKVAQLWGSKRGNTKMTYEKLSRAMRTYYDKHILEPVPKTGRYPKKLVYKFGEKASGWRKSQLTMMYYYKNKILAPVTHRRLVYRFGPNATNWRHPNPNFRRPV